jgi:hypothetical protein
VWNGRLSWTLKELRVAVGDVRSGDCEAEMLELCWREVVDELGSTGASGFGGGRYRGGYREVGSVIHLGYYLSA